MTSTNGGMASAFDMDNNIVEDRMRFCPWPQMGRLAANEGSTHSPRMTACSTRILPSILSYRSAALSARPHYRIEPWWRRLHGLKDPRVASSRGTGQARPFGVGASVKPSRGDRKYPSTTLCFFPLRKVDPVTRQVPRWQPGSSSGKLNGMQVANDRRGCSPRVRGQARGSLPAKG